jgi:hypothetical protein
LSSFADPWNPTVEELRAWAYKDDAMWPGEDWDLAVTSEDRAELILQLAMDPACPSRDFFLRCLYLLVGDAVRTSFVVHSRQAVIDLLNRVPADCPPDIGRWVARARELIQGPPEAVDRDLWCDGGYARAEHGSG